MVKPLVGIVMGSDSDLKIMKEAAKILAELGIASEVIISSAHRVPEQTAQYARTAEERGLEAIIAGAGMAAHLPGVIAAMTPLPVIGVPIQSGALSGVDALYAIVQMPPGIPVATVAINGALNAAILALQMIATGDASAQEKLAAYKVSLKNKITKANQELAAVSYKYKTN